MNNRNKLILLIITISITMCSSSCIIALAGAISKKKAVKELTIEKGQIPPDFANDQSIILAIAKDSNYDKSLAKGFEKYLGDYEIVFENELQDSKYEEFEKYRYIFDWEPIYKTTTYTDGRTTTSVLKRFYIYDRLDEKRYGPEKQSSFYSKTIQAYIKNFNEIIENN